MTDAVKKEELGDNERFHQHNDAGCNDGQETDYVEDAKDIEDNIAWTGQALEDCHFNRQLTELRE